MKAIKTFFSALLICVMPLIYVSCEKPSVSIIGDEEGDDAIFQISVSDITAGSALINVVPQDKEMTYFFDIISKKDYEGYSDKLNIVKDYIKENQEWLEYLGLSFTDILLSGEQSYQSYSFEAKSQYYVWCVGVNSDQKTTTDLIVYPFETTELVPSKNTFKVTVSGAEVSVVPSNDDPYIYDVFDAEEIADMSDAEIIENLKDYYENLFYEYIVTGKDSYEFDLESGDYTVVVFGYNGGPTTKVTTHNFTYTADEGGYIDDEPSTTLTEDITPVIKGGVEAYCYGDYYESGTNNWILNINVSKDGDEFIQAEFFTKLNTTTPSGTYKLVEEDKFSFAVGEALQGYYDDEGYLWGTAYGKADKEGYITDWALLQTGTITITNKAGNYMITIDCEDEFKHKVKCEYSGPIEIFDGNAVEDSANILSKKQHKSQIKAQKSISSHKALRKEKAFKL